jgi:hypothetical protein
LDEKNGGNPAGLFFKVGKVLEEGNPFFQLTVFRATTTTTTFSKGNGFFARGDSFIHYI